MCPRAPSTGVRQGRGVDWDQQVAQEWADPEAPGFLDRVTVLAGQCPTGDGAGVFELACAHDSTGHPARAVELYEEARTLGLTGLRRRRSSVQLASSLRNVGRAAEGVELLTAELAEPADELSDAVRGFLALCLADVGREREALGLALGALAPHLPRYQRSLGAYAAQLRLREPLGPTVRQVVLDGTDVRGLAEFYRQLLGYEYRPGDEPVADEDPDWLVLRGPAGAVDLAFQRVAVLTPTTWPDDEVPMQLHLDCTVPDLDGLRAVHRRALELGAVLRADRSDDPEEPLFVYADPAGHPFCVFVAPGG